MGSTHYLGLSTTPESTNKVFKTWRMEIDGEGDSNMEKIDAAYGDMKVNKLLTSDEIPDTTQEYTFTADRTGISQIVHTDEHGNVVRTDSYTYGANNIIETRVLDSGESLTITTDLTTLQTTVEYSAT